METEQKPDFLDQIHIDMQASKEGILKAHEFYKKLFGESYVNKIMYAELNAFASCYITHVTPLQEENKRLKEEVQKLKDQWSAETF